MRRRRFIASVAEPLLVCLDLVVAGDNLGVTGRRVAVAGPSHALLVVGRRRVPCLCRRGCLVWFTVTGGGSSAVVQVVTMLRGRLELGLLILGGAGKDAAAAALAVVDEDVDVAIVAVLGIVSALLVLIVVREVRVLGYDVPGVNEAGEIAENEEENIDDGVC